MAVGGHRFQETKAVECHNFVSRNLWHSTALVFGNLWHSTALVSRRLLPAESDKKANEMQFPEEKTRKIWQRIRFKYELLMISYQLLILIY